MTLSAFHGEIVSTLSVHLELMKLKSEEINELKKEVFLSKETTELKQELREYMNKELLRVRNWKIKLEEIYLRLEKLRGGEGLR